MYKSFVEKPNTEDIEKLLLEKKKEQLIKMYNLDEINQLESDSKEILKENKIN